MNKQCTKCGEEKSLDAFSRRNSRPSGYSSSCKVCCSAHFRRWRESNVEHQRARSRDWYADNTEIAKERMRERAKAQYANDPVKVNERNRKWVEANPEKVAEMRWHYREANKEQVKNRRRIYYEANTEKVKESVNQWAKRQPEKYKQIHRNAAHRRRLQVADGRCDLTLAQWDQIKAFYGHRCAFCGKKVKLTQDHIIPLSKGGEHTASNIMPLCLPCNSSKGNREISKTFQPHLLMASIN